MSLSSILPDQQLAGALEEAFTHEDNEYRGKPYMPLSGFPESIAQARAWAVWGSTFGFHHDGERYLANPEAWTWHRLALQEFQRLHKTITWLRGPAGTGKTYELVSLSGSWDGMQWYLCPSNVACEVVRMQMNERKVSHGDSVMTPHVRFELAGANGWSGFPKWWPRPANAGKIAKSRLYVLDEVFFWDARTLALSLACIPTGSIVVLAGDPLQNRPVDGCEIAYWLHTYSAQSVAAGSASAAQMILGRAGRAADLPLGMLDDIKHLDAGKTLSIELTQIRRSDRPAITAAREYLFARHQLPAEGEGLKITRSESIEAAVQLAVSRIRQGYRVVAPTNVLSLRIGGEFNRAENVEGGAMSLDLGDSGTSTELSDALYFRRGQSCMVLVNDHQFGLHNGLVCRYYRWHRPDGRSQKAWHEIDVPVREQSGQLTSIRHQRYKLYYQPGKHSWVMSQPLSKLRQEFGDDVVSADLGSEQENACAGLLASPHALTNHRAQGSTFEKTLIVIPPHLGPWMCAEWLYVAISRAKTDVELVFATDPKLTPQQQETLFKAQVERLTTQKLHAPDLFQALKPAAEKTHSSPAAVAA